MEVRNVKTPSAAYQGSGPEVAVKQETVVKQEAAVKQQTVVKQELVQGSVAKSEKKSDQKASSEKLIISEDEKNVVDSGEQSKKNSVKRAVEEVNRKAKSSELIFGIHDATNRVTIKVIDKGTREVIREFPPEETLDMIAKVWELAGIMIDERG
ncbi:hypothetical protein C806_00656 [Lachnospiraceae bacterium 3-1]|nr:hypothetical protein C806_00656 [Lachnospiraceae bacterium 3-1]